MQKIGKMQKCKNTKNNQENSVQVCKENCKLKAHLILHHHKFIPKFVINRKNPKILKIGKIRRFCKSEKSEDFKKSEKSEDAKLRKIIRKIRFKYVKTFGKPIE